MAARKTKFLSDEHRLKIKTTQLINRLTEFVEGNVEMSSAQVNAALGLLKKSLPDLSAVSAGVSDDGSLQGLKSILDEINGTSAGIPEAEEATIQ
jgi:hypothetical protein